MTLTLSEFKRSMRKVRRAADAGAEMVVQERRSGARYVFKAAKAVGKGRTFGEKFGHLIGSVKGGPPDLSTSKKYFADFGRG